MGAPAAASAAPPPSNPPPWHAIATSPLSPTLALAQAAARGTSASDRASASMPSAGVPLNAEASWGGFPVNSTPLAVNPLNADDLLSAGTDENCTTFAATYVSTDGGRTWTGSCTELPVGWWWGCGEAVVGFGADGLAYRAEIVSPGSFCSTSPGAAQTSLGFDVSRDGGQTWRPLSTLPSLHPYGLIDMPELTVDTGAASPRRGTIYVSATQYEAQDATTTIAVSRSADGGATWSTAPVSLPAPARIVDQFSDVAVAADGTLTTSWLQCTEDVNTNVCAGTAATLMAARSTDGGVTWSVPATIAAVTLPPDTCSCAFYGNLPNTAEWTDDIPVLGVGGDGIVHAVFDTWTGSAIELETASSPDGSTWTAPSAFAGAAVHDQFMPWMSVSSSGELGVSWLDRRDDSADVDYVEYEATSTDGVSFSAPQPLAGVPSNPFQDGYGGAYLGTRSGNAWDGDAFYAAWPDTRAIDSQDEVGSATPFAAGAGIPPSPALNPWRTSGPVGWGSVQQIAVDPQNPDDVYAAAGPYGVYRSTDGGASWSATGAGIAPNLVFNGVSIDPQSPSTVYAATEGGGVYVTSDGGQRWQQSSEGMLTAFVRAVAVAPSDQSVVYAGNEAYNEPSNIAGLYRSGDGGRHWQLAGNGLPPDFPFLCLAVDPTSPDTVYAAGGLGGGGLTVYKTLDGGQDWTSSSTGLPVSGAVYAMTVDPSTGTVFIGLTANGADPPAGVYRSSDGGASWTTGSAGWPSTADNVFSVAVTPGGGSIYAGTTAGVLVSRDGGSSWSAAAGVPDGTVVSSVALAASDPQRVFAAGVDSTLGGVFRSDDSGATWTRADSGLPGNNVAAYASTPSALYAAQGTSVFRSIDEGASWQATGGELPLYTSITSLAATPSGSLFAGLTGPNGSTGVWRSDDVGATWRQTSFGASTVWSLIADPAAPQTLWAGIGDNVLTTTDGGVTWTPSTAGFPSNVGFNVSALAEDPSTPATLYAGTLAASAGPTGNGTTDKALGVFKSLDGGATWTAVDAGLPSPAVEALAVAPSAPQTLYAGLEGFGVAVSTDGGASWASTSLGSGVIDALAVDPANASHVYAGTPAGGDIFGEPSGGAFESRDGGSSWALIGLTGIAINALTIDGARVLHAGTGAGDFDLAGPPGAAIPEWPAGLGGLVSLLVLAEPFRRRRRRR